MSAPILYIVIPCYNEEEVLNETHLRLSEKLKNLISSGICSSNSRMLFVDDGSSDGTWSIIARLHEQCELTCGLKLAHNRGHQNALWAGLMTAKDRADCIVSMDADLQDDIDALDSFMSEFADGNDIVYGVRSSRKNDTAFKRSTARGFYKFMNVLGAEVVYDHADYRLMSKRAVDALSEYDEVNLFLRGMVPDLGFKSSSVPYERHERFAGKSKYPLKKMISFAVDGITSFSVKPLKIISNVGITVSILSILGLIYALVSKFCFPDSTVAGWTAIIASIWLLGGIQLFCLGIIGEYVGKIFSEVKHRPKYIPEQTLLK